MGNPIAIVQGGQYGSCAKGHIAAYLCEKDQIDYNVRTGATNAGHTVYYKGQPYAMQQLGCGWVNPDTSLVLGAGSLIDPEILDREVALVTAATGKDVRKRLWIDPRAGVHLREHSQRSSESGRHHRIGATGKGCSEALIDRIKREKGLFGDHSASSNYQLVDTERMLNSAYDIGAKILLEGTQGQLLDLYLGPYPYTTHKQTGPAQWMLEAGLSPALPTEITMVVRSFPIRVAGNSGPLPNEISWTILAGEINGRRRRAGLDPIVRDESLEAWEMALLTACAEFKLPPGRRAADQHQWTPNEREQYASTLSELNAAAWKLLPESIQQDLRKLFELTTVTKKLRRIARFDTIQFQNALRQVRPKYLALTFANYLEPDRWFEKPDVVKGSLIGVPTHLISYGPESSHIVDRREEMK